MEEGIGKIMDPNFINKRDELCRSSYITNGIEWKIHYFSYISLGQCGIHYESPLFRLLRSDWYLDICKSSESDKDDAQWFGLYLCRDDEDAYITKNIQFTFGIRNSDGVIHNIRSGKIVFHDNANRAGVRKFLRQSLRNSPTSGRRDAFHCTPDNCLTIFCVMNECPLTMISEDGGGSIGIQRNEKHVDYESSSSEDEESDDENDEFRNRQGKVVFCKDMKRLFDSEQLCDVKILVNGEEIRAHKAILAARSPVFSAMFEHEMKEKKSDFVEISDSKLDAFKEFLRYLYTGNPQEVSLMHICEMYVLADKYNVKQLTRDCIDIMEDKVSLDNFCDFTSLAIKYNESDLLDTMTEYFVINTKAILQTVQWQSFMAENPKVANELFLKYCR